MLTTNQHVTLRSRVCAEKNSTKNEADETCGSKEEEQAEVTYTGRASGRPL